MSYVREHEQEFICTANEYSEQAMKKALSQQQKELDKAEKRINELDILFRKLYEDNALGKLSDERFVFLTSGYEDEKKALTQRITELRKEISTAAERGADVRKFIALVRRYTAIDELTYEKLSADELGLREMLSPDGVTKARKAALERLRSRYPGSGLHLWRDVYHALKDISDV